MGKLVNLLSSGVGLVSEALASNKHSKTPASSSSNAGEGNSRDAHSNVPADAPPQYAEATSQHAHGMNTSGPAVSADSKDRKLTYPEHPEDENAAPEGDEQLWALDEASRAPNNEDNPTTQSEASLADEFMRSHPPPAYTELSTTPRGRLPCPVIIPQRRPKDKKRGFVRAYAPALEECGIDQATFMDFLKKFHSACQSSGYLKVINVAAAGAGMAPSVIATAVSIGVRVTAGTAAEVQERSRTNTFLDRMNEDFFKPHGLYCLIMTYKPSSNQTHETIDINTTIATSTTESTSAISNQLNSLRLSSGKTYGDMELPKSCPLIFPDLEDLADDNTEEGKNKQNKLKSSQKFVADYFDRRAQANYKMENPGSKLAVNEGGEGKGFANRWADPSSKANQGGLIGFVTGGLVDPRARRQDRRAGRRERRGRGGGYSDEDGNGEGSSTAAGQTSGGRRGQRRQGIVKRALAKDVLYLMIVNLPSEEELAVAREALANQARQQ